MTVCSHCKQEREKVYSCGRCRECMREYYAANKEKIAERQRGYRAANREKIAERMRGYYAANREKIAEQKRGYRAANREKIAEQMRGYYAANREKIAEQMRKERTKNINLAKRSNAAPSQFPGFVCAHCGRTTIRRFTGQRYCKRSECQKAEEKEYKLPVMRGRVRVEAQ